MRSDDGFAPRGEAGVLSGLAGACLWCVSHLSSRFDSWFVVDSQAVGSAASDCARRRRPQITQVLSRW
jgi:hypothetical protein